MPPILELISMVSLAFCALLGLGALFSPAWAARTVRLVADPSEARPGGYSEFRATYGGLLFLLHMTGLVILIQQDLDIIIRLAAILPIAMAWIGAGIGRAASLFLDDEANRSNGLIPVWIPFEIGLGLAIGAPLFQFLF